MMQWVVGVSEVTHLSGLQHGADRDNLRIIRHVTGAVGVASDTALHNNIKQAASSQLIYFRNRSSFS